jgi:hypothetical protein
VLVTVGEDQIGSGPDNCLGSCDEGVGWDDHLIPLADACAPQRHLDGVGPVADADAVLDCAEACVLVLELCDLWTQHECACLENLGNTPLNLSGYPAVL